MKKNVLMILYNYYLWDTRVRREAEALSALSDFELTVISLKNKHWVKKQKVDNVNIIEVNQKKYNGISTIRYIFSYLKYFILSFFICTKKFALGEVDFVHIHNMPNFLIFAAIIPKIFKKKIILDVHDTVPETYADKFIKKSSIVFKALCLEEYISTLFADKIICVNQPQVEALSQRRIPEEKISILMNVPDSKRFNSDVFKEKRKNINNKFRLIYHGTIAKRLGVDLIVKAVAQLTEKIPNIEFNIWARDNSEMDRLEILSESLNVQERIHCLRGGVPVERVPIELQKMDLGVIGNRKGIATDLMLPVKMLEYIAVGIPVVAPRLKCIQHYFTEDMVAYYEPECIDSMAGAILSIYNSRKKRERQVQQASIFFERYGWDKHKNVLINMYRGL